MPDTGTDMVKAMLKEGEIHMVTFTSSSTVTNFAGMFKADGEEFRQWMKNVAVACIGPITAKTAEENGFNVSLVSEEYTIEALTKSIVQYFS